MNGMEKLREYAHATKWGGECRILHAHHGDFAGDCSERECNECKAEYLHAIADEAQENMRDAEARLMPEGMAWPTVDGEPVDFNTGYVPSLGVLEAVSIYSNGACEVMSHDGIVKNVKDIHIARPKVLDSDGAEIREKRDAWWICEGDERGVHAERLRVETIRTDGLVECYTCNGGTWVYLEPSELYVKEPVLAADGRPLREGEHVYHVETGAELVVKKLPKPGEYQAVVVFALPTSPASHLTSFDPDRLTHERPVADTWERLEEDATLAPLDYVDKYDIELYDREAGEDEIAAPYAMARDLVCRCRALAERERGE